MLGWTASQLSVVAELSENCVWNSLTAQGGGDLHVFVPVRDRGLDGVVHRLSDGAYLDVQVKARSMLEDGQMHLVVWAEELVFDDALIVGVHLDGERLGPYCLVCTEAEFKRRAHLGTGDGKPMYSASINFHPERGGRWADLMVPAGRLGERFDAKPTPGLDVPAAQVARGDRGGLGQLGEAEVLRRLAQEVEVALFRPRTDLETVELVARRLTGGSHLGLQVKCEGAERITLPGGRETLELPGAAHDLAGGAGLAVGGARLS